MNLVHDHDLELNALRGRASTMSPEDLAVELEAIDARIADAVLDVCRTNLAKLEQVVDSVLQIEQQMRIIRTA